MEIDVGRLYQCLDNRDLTYPVYDILADGSFIGVAFNLNLISTAGLGLSTSDELHGKIETFDPEHDTGGHLYEGTSLDLVTYNDAGGCLAKRGDQLYASVSPPGYGAPTSFIEITRKFPAATSIMALGNSGLVLAPDGLVVKEQAGYRKVLAPTERASVSDGRRPLRNPDPSRW